jgi:hypothetical protein
MRESHFFIPHFPSQEIRKYCNVSNHNYKKRTINIENIKNKMKRNRER